MNQLKKLRLSIQILLFISILFLGCDNTLNSPHGKKARAENRFYTTFSEKPKTLDPARSYWSNEYEILGPILETPLQYHYLKRPYQLIPLALKTLPEVDYLDASMKTLKPKEKAKAAYTRYRLNIKPGRFYSSHPAFVRNQAGHFEYYPIKNSPKTLTAFDKTATRELLSEDFVYQIKRLADPKVHSPIFSLMAQHILGFSELSKRLETEHSAIDLKKIDFLGARATSRYGYEILIKGHYPQLRYWLTMPFFAPTPWEVDQFYQQPALIKNNLTFDWYPIGTGPYQLTLNNPNRLMILERNPNFAGELYPMNGEDGDREKGLLDRAGKSLPLIESIYFYLEKETIPRWAKFLQGFYDRSAIGTDSFNQAVQLQADGSVELTKAMQEKKLQLNSSVLPTVFYIGFNMLSNKVGGYTAKQTALRQAIGIAVDMEEYVSIFLNGQGMIAQSPIPPDIFGYRDDFNPYIYQVKNKHVQRRSLREAKKLLSRAGYPEGIDPRTKRPLMVYFDVVGNQGPDDKARFDWFRKQFKKLNLALVVRATQYNRFQEKIRNGTAELYYLGWNADYPDPENFLSLFYGPNAKVTFHGVNASNYHNQEFDAAFEKMRALDNTPERLKLIKEMTALLQRDAPWLFGFFPKSFLLSHQWLRPAKLSGVSNNNLKYQALNPKLRSQLQTEWNQANLWPLLFLLFILAGTVLLFVYLLRQKECSHESLSN